MPPWLGGCVVFLLLAVMPLGGCVPFGLFVWFVLRVPCRFLVALLLFVCLLGSLRFFPVALWRIRLVLLSRLRVCLRLLLRTVFLRLVLFVSPVGGSLLLFVVCSCFLWVML